MDRNDITKSAYNVRWITEGAREHTEIKTPAVFLQVFFKCHYDYDPANDNLIPCKEAGLRFETGDILQIVNQDDVNWWQVEYRNSMYT